LFHVVFLLFYFILFYSILFYFIFIFTFFYLLLWPNKSRFLGWIFWMAPPFLTSSPTTYFFIYFFIRSLFIMAKQVYVSGLDLLDGTPILDIKPYIGKYDSFAGASVGWLEEFESEDSKSSTGSSSGSVSGSGGSSSSSSS
jgi:uncharacterized membrane protein YgcG